MHRIDHFTVANKAQISRAKELSNGISHTRGHVGFWGDTFSNYVLADNIDPLKWDEEIGAVWSLRSDSPVTDVNPIRYLHTAVTRLQYLDFKTCLGREQRVGLLTALTRITINPASSWVLMIRRGPWRRGRALICGLEFGSDGGAQEGAEYVEGGANVV
jgi:predicted amidohydrolase YtcJ